MFDRNIFISPMRPLGEIFAKHGHSLYLVGGCVRDFLVGEVPKDIDLATSATPEEQIEIYDAAGLKWLPTGLNHGTVTVKFEDEFYEITTFRIDKETDGRHAIVEYVTDVEGSDILEKFIELGYDPSEKYDVEELNRVFQRIDR